MKKYKDLQEPCKSMLSKEKCLGCNKLEDPEFTGDKNCAKEKEEWYTNLKLIND